RSAPTSGGGARSSCAAVGGSAAYGCGVPLAGKAERAEREAGQMRSCTPMTSASSATGRQLGESQKTLACPKARQNRSRHRYADPRTATLHARAKLRPKRPFLLDRARPVFFSARR